jgi:two-component system response regulator YesN
MPFINGLEMIERIKETQPGAVIIIISGHDEFGYAQQALKLRVFDYLLKPVQKERLEEVVTNAVRELETRKEQNRYLQMATSQLNKNLPYLREDFLRNIIENSLSNREIEEGISFFKLNIPDECVLIYIKKANSLSIEDQEDWDGALLDFAIENISHEILSENAIYAVFRDKRSNLLAIVDKVSEKTLLYEQVKDAIRSLLETTVVTCSAPIKRGLHDLNAAYMQVVVEVEEKYGHSPIVSRTIKYMEDHYTTPGLSIKDIADKLNISTAYISRLLKNETGCTFVELLTKIRINNSVKYLDCVSVKIVDIASKVGYSTQHYYCTAFKKVMGISPSQYRKMGGDK